ncbi:hypothetical protein EDD16DRAFT_1523107 [Pisolithus croceorrhizus]|nr:hypothetical protein EDD16DRAFT_1523107 [Pisolithus croceorrhizus]
MSSCRAFNISPSMIHLQAFYWLKQFAEGSILLNMALDSIKFTLGSNFKSNQVAFPTVSSIYHVDTQESSSSTKHESPPSVSGIQESSSSTGETIPSVYADVPWNNPMIPLVAVPLLKDPSAWRLMMDWAQDKIGFSELDDRMRAYGPVISPRSGRFLSTRCLCCRTQELKVPVPPPVVERAMESQGINAEDEGEEDEGEEEEEDEEGRRNYGPQQLNFIQTQGFEVTTLPWLPHRLKAVDLGIQSSASTSNPKLGWIKQSAYKGDIGCNLQELQSIQDRGYSRGYSRPLREKQAMLSLCMSVPLSSLSCNPTKPQIMVQIEFTHFQGTKPSQVTWYVHTVAHILAGGIIEWIGSDGKVWVFMHGKGKGKEDVLADEENPAPSQTVVAMNVSDLRIERPPNTLTFTKDKGYNVAMGDTVEVVRGQWCDSQGIVKAVDLTKASLDIVCPTDRVQINVPITFSRKIMGV